MNPGARSWRGSAQDPPASSDGEPPRAPKTFAFICCSPHGRAGASTSARLLSDYFLATQRDFAGFDADPHEPDYAPRFGDRVTGVDLAAVPGQIALIDGLLAPDGKPKILDLWSRSYERFFTLIEEIGFIEEARVKGVEPVFLYHADGSDASSSAAWRLASRFPDIETLLVHNEGAAPLEGATHQILAAHPPHRRFKVGALDPTLRRTLTPMDLSLSYFLLESPEGMSLVVRAGLKAWLAPIFSQLRAFELRHALDGLSSLL